MRYFPYPFLIVGMLVLSSCQSAFIKKENERIHSDKSIIKNEILAQINDLENQKAIETDYRKYNLISKKVISPHMKAVIFTYDTVSISPAKMLHKLKADERFSTVEFNKLLSVRDK